MAIPGVPTHVPGGQHPYDPLNCPSDAWWQQQRNIEAAYASQHAASQAAPVDRERLRQIALLLLLR
jgi:hypothetical protein